MSERLPIAIIARCSAAETLCARVLGLAGLAALASALLWTLNHQQPLFKDWTMWLKALGLVCAGVFVGAALIEAKQMLRGKRLPREEDTEGEPATSSAATAQRAGE